jgi:hypothetical protein
MDSHLPDDHAVAKRLFIQLRTDAGRTQGAVAAFPNDDFRVELGTYDSDFGILNIEFGKDLLGNIDHPVEIAIAAGHAAAAEDYRAADFLAGRHHVTVVGLHRLALEIFGAGAEIIRACVHRSAIANDGIHAALQSRLQRFVWIAISKRATGRNDTVNHVRHQLPLH